MNGKQNTGVSLSMEEYQQSKEGQALLFLDQMQPGEFDLSKMASEDKRASFRTIVNQVIEMQWDKMNGYELSWNINFTILYKKMIQKQKKS